MSLTFDPVTHTYTFDGVVVPSVTQGLRQLYDFSMISPDVLARKAAIGTAVHAAVDLDLAGELDEASISPTWAGYLAGWRKFVADTGLTDADIGIGERPMVHPTLRFAGTPDRTILIDGKWGVLDLKTTVDLHPAVALQLAAYKELVNVNTKSLEHLVETRYALQLKSDGGYRLQQYKEKADWTTFLSLLNVEYWKRKSS